MHHQKDQLVHHPTLGLAKVLTVDGNRITVFFKDQQENPTRTIVADRLEPSELQTDPYLDNLDRELAISGKLRSYITREGAIEKFLRKYPTGFTTDPSSPYWKDERGYKWEAHVAWNQLLDRATFKELIDAGKYREIANRAARVITPVNLVSKLEKAALQEGLASTAAAKAFAVSQYEFLHGKGPDKVRFTRLVEALHGLPQTKTATAKWTTATIVPFLARPERYLFLKPEVTKVAAERRGFALNYKPFPNWLTYSRLLELGKILMTDLSELKPRDMIDIQSFIWITGE